MGASRSWWEARRLRGGPARSFVAVSIVAFVAVIVMTPVSASAGQASSGTLLFYPCTKCHPVTIINDVTGQTSHPLPIPFKGHKITLESHDVLGKSDAACFVCHDLPSRNPGMLHAVDGTLIDVKTGDIALLCEKCHFEKYTEFRQGIHGKHFASCVVAGCHDPHTPGYIYVAALPPFLGTGFQIQPVGPDRVPFKPLMSPAPPPPTVNPTWYVVVTVIGLIVALAIFAGLAVPAVVGRLKR
jgi:hypothetical protein